MLRLGRVRDKQRELRPALGLLGKIDASNTFPYFVLIPLGRVRRLFINKW